MIIIGINFDMFISSAALLVDGELVAAAAEERFTRTKRTKDFPAKAINYCLNEAGLSGASVDVFVTSWNPAIYLRKFNPAHSRSPRHKSEHLFSVPDHLNALIGQTISNETEIHQTVSSSEEELLKTVFLTHHKAHAANGFFLSPFEHAAVLTADSQGEAESTTFSLGADSELTQIKSVLYPNSVGAFYSTFTEYLGFIPNSDEWRVMALASYAGGRSEYDALMSKTYRLLSEGDFEFDLNFFKGFIHDQPNLFTEKLTKVFGPPRKSGEELQERHYQIAGAVQNATERVIFHALRWLHKSTKEKNLAVSGGTFMNSVLNGKVLAETGFDQFFVSPAPDDSGNALGAAFYYYHQVLKNKRRTKKRQMYLGPAYSNEFIGAELEQWKIKSTRVEDPAKVAAEKIASGEIIGWFQGRAEFGQRALGNRSILADPRKRSMKDRVNQAVKFRESFRPFAPAVLADHVQKFFSVNEHYQAPFMEKVVKIREERKSEIPAVVHVDGTGRLQTVQQEDNSLFYALIDNFRTITGVPLVLNTSFNQNGEPVFYLEEVSESRRTNDNPAVQ